MKSIKEYASRFLHDESGAELLEIAIGVVVAVSLIAIIMTLRDTIFSNIDSANGKANEQFASALSSVGERGSGH